MKVLTTETKTKINELLKSFGFGISSEFTEVKLADGTIVRYDGELEAGIPFSIVDEVSGVIPAPDKTYEMEDGTMVTTEGGIVTNVEVAEVEVAEEEMASGDVIAKLQEIMDMLKGAEEMKVEVETLKAEMAIIKAAHAADQSFVKEVADLVNTIGSASVEAPIQAPKKVFGETKTEKLENIAKAFKIFKK